MVSMCRQLCYLTGTAVVGVKVFRILCMVVSMVKYQRWSRTPYGRKQTPPLPSLLAKPHMTIRRL